MAVKKAKSDTTFLEQAKVFNQEEEVRKEDIIAAGERALVCLYGGAEEDSLDHVRYRHFCEKVFKGSSFVEPQTLPPTSAAAKYHSLCVYYQVMEWKDTGVFMRPEDWGWHIVDGKCLPKQTYLPPAPLELLDVICCNCKKDWNSKRCTCRKYDLHCSAGCGQCHGTSCANSEHPDLTDDYDADQLDK